MRLFALVYAVVLGLGAVACATNDDPIANDLNLGDDDDERTPADDDDDDTPSGSSGGRSSSGGGSSGAPSSSSGGGSSSGGAPLGEEFSGRATWYNVELTDRGNCDLACPSTYLVAALNTADYDGAALCGGCIEVTGPDGSVTVQVWDRCPGCGEHGVDLSKTAFGKVSPTSAGNIAITWKLVSCPSSGNVSYDVQAGDLQVLGHRLPLDKVEVGEGGDYTELARRSDNHWTGTIPDDTFDIRLTATDGQVLEDQVDGFGSHAGAVQFE